MRFLFVSTETRPVVGGVASALDSWLTGLAENGHQVLMLGLMNKASLKGKDSLNPRQYAEEWVVLPDRVDSHWDDFLLLRKARSAEFLRWRRLLILQRFTQVADVFQPDWVIFSVLNQVCCTPLGEAKRLGLRCATIAYGSEIHPNRVTQPDWLRRTLGRVDRVIAISNYTKRTLIDWGVKGDRISIVHPGLGPEIIERARKTSLTTHPGNQLDEGSQLRLLTICRLIERKGIQTVMQCIAQLRNEFPELHYDIVGEGPYRGELERLARELDIEKTVTFHGMIPDEERDDLLRICDIFVMLSFEAQDGDVEGFGIVFLEAGLYSKSVIGSDSGGIPDAVIHQETGLLVPPQDVAALIRALYRIHTDMNLRKRFEENGQIWAREHFPQWCGQKIAKAL